MRARMHLLVLGTIVAPVLGQPSSVVDSPHNLSASGPRSIRATSESEVCIFCHTPHNASPIQPLWNRAMPGDAYTVYSSRALEAEPGQPTGMSKMCLSCHDGTIALGSVFSRGSPIPMAGGVTTMPPGPGHIGTDLRDDHPISFPYSSSLASRNGKLHSPGALPPEIRLDGNSELQCTSCHDAHNDSLGKFLVMRNTNSQLCTSCHQVGATTIGGHANCSDCHQPHSAPSGPYLLRKQTVTDTCLACHNGTVAGAANLSSEMSKLSVHDTQDPVDPPGKAWEHTTCTSCHEPHTMNSGGGGARAGVHPNFGSIAGVNAGGSPVVKAAFEYEVCFRCHGDANRIQPAVPRRITQNNTRLEFSPTAVSFHPVETTGRNQDVPSLKPGWTTASTMTCSSCHGSDTGLGSGPKGTHGSNYAPLLSERYETEDFTSESAGSYALCYKCHDRTNILSNASFPGHKQHIVDLRTPCSACHDAHGIASGQGSPTGNSNLINFASNIVFPDRATGRLEFRDAGMFSGECYLTCHGRDHSPARYPDTPGALRSIQGGRRLR